MSMKDGSLEAEDRSAVTKGRWSVRAALPAGVERLATLLSHLSVAAVLVIMVLVVADVLGRAFLSRPVPGSVGMVQLLMAVVIFCVVGLTTIAKGHVVVDVLLDRLSPKVRNVLMFLATLISLLFAGLMCRQLIIMSESYAARGIYEKTTRIPLHPFIILAAIGTAVMVLAFATLMVGYFKGTRREKLLKTALGMLVLVVLVMLLLFGNQLPKLSPAVTAAVGFIVMLILMIGGVPVAFALIGVGTLGLVYTRGIESALNMIADTSFKTSTTYTFSVLIMFMLMGVLAFHAGFGKDLYELVYRWVGRLRGGLAMATITASALFGAIVGDSTAGVATFGRIALPEMRARKYDLSLSSACIVVGAVLCEMIPPSMTFILWAVLTETNVGELFMAGIVPGILVMAGLWSYVYIRCRLNPLIGPQGPVYALRERIAALKYSLPVIVIFCVVMGGLYGGIFTPTEAGSIGAFAVLVAGFAMRRMGARKCVEACRESVRVVAMCFFVLIGAQLFGSFLATTKVPTQLAEAVATMNLPPMLVVVGMLAVWISLGFIMPAIGILLLFTPIVLPMLEAFGFDLVWCGVIFCFAIHIGTVTPPVAINAFVLKGVAPEVPLGTIFRGTLPMLVILLAALALMVAVPQLSTFLPGLLR